MSHSSTGAVGPLPQASAPNGVSVTTYHGVGVVERIDRKNNVIMIKHENIKGYHVRHDDGVQSARQHAS
jgi:hypothetical protein